MIELTGYDIYDGEHVQHRTLCEKHGQELLHTTDMVVVRACEGFHKNEDYCEQCEEDGA